MDLKTIKARFVDHEPAAGTVLARVIRLEQLIEKLSGAPLDQLLASEPGGPSGPAIAPVASPELPSSAPASEAPPTNLIALVQPEQPDQPHNAT